MAADVVIQVMRRSVVSRKSPANPWALFLFNSNSLMQIVTTNPAGKGTILSNGMVKAYQQIQLEKRPYSKLPKGLTGGPGCRVSKVVPRKKNRKDMFGLQMMEPGNCVYVNLALTKSMSHEQMIYRYNEVRRNILQVAWHYRYRGHIPVGFSLGFRIEFEDPNDYSTYFIAGYRTDNLPSVKNQFS